jgi:hypothetical protein
MNRIIAWITLLAIVLIGVCAIAQEDNLDAESILSRVNSIWQGNSFHGIIGLDISLSGQTKSYKLEVWTLGEKQALMRVMEPEIDLNSGYLQMGDELWYYSPAVGPIKLPSVALGDALFGAGPSLDDLSRATLSDDYDATAESTETGYFLTLIPHTDAPVVYGKLEIWVSADYIIEKLIYYDQRGDVLQTADFSDIIEVGERKFATTIVIEDAYGDKTVERIEDPEFDLTLDASFFSLDTFDGWEDR